MVGCPGTSSVDQVGLALRDPPGSAPLGLKVSSGHHHHLVQKPFKDNVLEEIYFVNGACVRLGMYVETKKKLLRLDERV